MFTMPGAYHKKYTHQVWEWSPEWFVRKCAETDRPIRGPEMVEIQRAWRNFNQLWGVPLWMCAPNLRSIPNLSGLSGNGRKPQKCDSRTDGLAHSYIPLTSLQGINKGILTRKMCCNCNTWSKDVPTKKQNFGFVVFVDYMPRSRFYVKYLLWVGFPKRYIRRTRRQPQSINLLINALRDVSEILVHRGNTSKLGLNFKKLRSIMTVTSYGYGGVSDHQSSDCLSNSLCEYIICVNTLSWQ